MKYAGFWIRALATAIDAALFGVPAALLIYIVYPESAVARASTIGVENILMLAYQIYFQATTGQTVGKYLVKIRVNGLAGERLGYKNAVVRNFWYLFGSLAAISQIVALSSVSAAEFAHSSEHVRAALLIAHRPAWWSIYNVLITVWCIFEIAYLVKSSQKRAVHDLMAKTVVIYSERT